MIDNKDIQIIEFVRSSLEEKNSEIDLLRSQICKIDSSQLVVRSSTKINLLKAEIEELNLKLGICRHQIEELRKSYYQCDGSKIKRKISRLFDW